MVGQEREVEMIVVKPGTRTALLMFSWFAFARLAAAGLAGAQEARPCCFVNVGYHGTCVVQPGEGETCESILTYLNTAGTVGKTYCDSSRTRGGWKLVDCGTSDDRQK